MAFEKLSIQTHGEGFVDITSKVEKFAQKLGDGILVIQNTHTSCGLTINESFDPLAKEDMENFLRHLAPENLKFIKHTDEGPDDSPSHMKSILVQPSLTVVVADGKMLLGQWQGIYLCEFRRAPKTRQLIIKLIEG